MKREIGILVSDEREKQVVNNGQIQLYTAIAGFKIETLPIVHQDGGQNRSTKQTQNVFSHEANLKQWANLINALHSLSVRESNVYTSFAIQFTAIPRHTLGANICLHFLVRVAASVKAIAKQNASTIATSLQKIFPKGDLKVPVLVPIPLNENEIRDALLHGADEIQLVTISKFVERPNVVSNDMLPESTVPIPHPFFLEGDSPLLRLIDGLEQVSDKVTIRCEIEPTRLTDDEEEFVSLLNHLFERKVIESEKQYDIVSQRASREQLNRSGNRTTPKDWAEKLTEIREADIVNTPPHQVERARRGRYVFKRIYEEQSKLFTMAISLACPNGKPVPDSIIACVLSAFSATEAQDARLGWKTPNIMKYGKRQSHEALQAYQWMFPTCCKSEPEKLRWDSLSTAREVLALFHIPALNGPAIGIETTFVPFYVTAELLRKMELTNDIKDHITLGYLYHSYTCYNPDTVGLEKALPYRLPVATLNRPTLISGAPGGGKSNWLFSLLIDSWKEHGIPWCVIDPSGGQEYRYLLAEESLKDQLVVYTIGDNLASPMRFNPFSLPPSGRGGSNTVRSHASKLVSCFKAASDMWTPLPEIFQEAVCRVYNDFEWSLDDTYETGVKRGLKFPSFSDFAQALDQEVELRIQNYGKGTEAAGILSGATRDRVDSIVNQLGHILDVPTDSSEFFQNLLKTPCVLELGSLGSEDTIALIMSFLLVQIAGHTEYAYRTGLRGNKQHLLCVEEAHILLSNEGSTKSNALQQGNPRGKAAEDFGRMLLEFRKFGCGIVLADQRIASLIGSAIDSAYLNLMFRTVAPASFDHLKTILNLDARQVEYAYTQLDEGRGILLDRSSGMPVLIRQRNILDELKLHPLTFEEFTEKTKSNEQRAGLNIREYLNEKQQSVRARKKADDTSRLDCESEESSLTESLTNPHESISIETRAESRSRKANIIRTREMVQHQRTSE